MQIFKVPYFFGLQIGANGLEQFFSLVFEHTVFVFELGHQPFFIVDFSLEDEVDLVKVELFLAMLNFDAIFKLTEHHFSRFHYFAQFQCTFLDFRRTVLRRLLNIGAKMSQVGLQSLHFLDSKPRYIRKAALEFMPMKNTELQNHITHVHFDIKGRMKNGVQNSRLPFEFSR